MADLPAMRCPGPLSAQALERLQALRDSTLPPAAVAEDKLWPHLHAIAAMSDFVPRSLAQQPGLLAQLLDGDLFRPLALDDYRERVAVALDQPDEASQLRALRQLRRAEMARIAWRDLAGMAADTAQTLAELSDFAEACIALCVADSERAVSERHGVARDAQGEPLSLVSIGMGKLGGRELNFSSDIDLIFCFADGGTTDGRKPLDHQQYFIRVAQRVIKLLGETTADGFVFRVDMRLRPFGNSGPMALSFDALEAYYLTQGREWERYAMIKARALSGRAQDIAALEDLLRPFVFRRYLDYGAIESLRELKATMMAEMVRKGLETSVKLGVGGIREIEFTGQAFQLVRGGREPGLQQRGIVGILSELGRLDLMSAEEVAFLQGAYDALRRLENRLQMFADQQTHALPTDETAQARLAFAMGEPDWASLLATFAPLRERVHAIFRAVFHVEEAEQVAQRSASPLSLAWGGDDPEAAANALAAAGYRYAIASAERLIELHQGGFYSRLSSKGQERLDQFVPVLLAEVAQSEQPDTTLERILGVVRAIAGRSVYLQVLLDNPHALALLARLCAASGPVAEFIARHPVVLDELLQGVPADDLPERDGVEALARQAVAHLEPDDLEQQMERLRQFRHAQAMRIAMADVLGELPLMRVSDHLTWLAEAVLTVSLALVRAPLVARHGVPYCVVEGERRAADMAIVAYGKLGGIELSYTSDLDIVFLHDSAGVQQRTDGDKPLDNGVFFGRVVQRLTHFLSTLTPGGVLYETDTRLRPNGKGGVLVSPLTAFERYQREEAWTWEHQALVRARVVVGGERLRLRFAAVRAEVLAAACAAASLREAVRDMRDKMRRELSRSEGNRVDLKQARGGVADIEFMVQYLVLAHSAEQPALLAWTDNVRLLDAAADAGVISAALGEALHGAWLAYRERVHQLALQGQRAVAVLDERLLGHRRAVCAAWQQLMVDPG